MGNFLRPSTFVEGGLIDDIDGKITDAKFTMFDYNGQQNPVPALGIEIEVSDGAGGVAKHEAYYSAGDAKYWRPNADGTDLTKTGDKDSITRSSKLGIFLTELINAGFSEDKIAAGNISAALVGLQAHFVRKADKERKGLVKKDDNKRESSTLIVSKIISLPGDKVASISSKPTAAAAASTVVHGAPTNGQSTPAAVSAAVEAVSDDECINFMFELLAANSNTIPKNRLSALAFKAIGKDHALLNKRTAVTQRVYNDEFLKTGVNSGLWAFDGTNVSIAS